MAAIGYPNSLQGGLSFDCGCSLISEQFALTAAHCRTSKRVSPTVVLFGSLSLKREQDDLPEMTIPIKKFIPHEDYDFETKQNDIALVQLKDAIRLANKDLRPACLWQGQFIPEPQLIASGWGYTAYGGEASDDLMKVKLDIMTNRFCARSYEDEGYVIGGKQICAGVLRGNKDTCQGGQVAWKIHSNESFN